MEPPPTVSVSDIQRDSALWYRLHVFLFDLRNFHSNPESQARLDNLLDPSYLSAPYFSDSQVSTLKAILLPTGRTLQETIANTLDERLSRRMKKRVERSDYRVCAAHDLAPIFEGAFGVKAKELAKDAVFLALMEAKGLDGGEGWVGLSKKARCGPKPRPGKRSKH